MSIALKSQIYAVLIFLLLFSCVEKEQKFERIIRNNTSVDLVIIQGNQTVRDSISIFSKGQKIIRGSSKSGLGPSYFTTEPVDVMYADSVMITHWRGGPDFDSNSAKRSIIQDSNWVGGKTGDLEDSYCFTFIEEDYKEAIDKR